MIETSPSIQDIRTLWGIPLQPAHCPQCNVAHLIPGNMEADLCPACFRAPLEPQPTVIRSEPPELFLDFLIAPDKIKSNLKDWLKGLWLHPKELNPEILTQRLKRTFIPLWLIDGRVSGNWQAQMGFDYQVASSQEIYNGGGWRTRKHIETRTRWEPRTGTIERTYQNLSVPALDEHTHLMLGIGKFNLDNASTYSSTRLKNAVVRVPSILPDAAWPQAKSCFNRLAAMDCQTGSDAQHIDEFTIEADYKDQIWTQLLLPVFTTAYRDENGKVYPILIHGQNGKIFGAKRASQKQARLISLSLTGVALVSFVLGLLFAVGMALLPLFGFVSLVFFASSLLLGIIAPIPAFWAWNFNRQQDEK